MKTYTQSEVNKIFSHIPPRTIRSWALILPLQKDLIKITRLGKHRQYTLENLYHLALIDELSSWGFPLEYIRAVFNSEHQLVGYDILKINKHNDDIVAFTWFLSDFLEYKIIAFCKEMFISGDIKKALLKADPSLERRVFGTIEEDAAYQEFIKTNNINSVIDKIFAPPLFQNDKGIKEGFKVYRDKDDGISENITNIIIDLRYLREFVRRLIEKAGLQ